MDESRETADGAPETSVAEAWQQVGNAPPAWPSPGMRPAAPENRPASTPDLLAEAMEREAQNRADAKERAAQYVAEWSQLQVAHQRHETSGDIQRCQQIEARMR